MCVCVCLPGASVLSSVLVASHTSGLMLASHVCLVAIQKDMVDVSIPAQLESPSISYTGALVGVEADRPDLGADRWEHLSYSAV